MADVTSPFGFPYPEDTDLVRDGASDIENLAEGVNDYLTGGYLYAGTEYYTSSGTFAKADPLGTGDIGLRAIRVRMVGGGGSGGGSGAAGESGGGGGGGGYAERFVTDIADLDASVTVNRGSGGAASVAGDNDGNAGGDSEFGLNTDAYYTRATGGSQGLRGSTPDGGGGGVGTNGDFLIGGSGGGSGSTVDTVGSGAGGASQLGGSARGRRGGINANQAGELYGGGSSGATRTAAGSSPSAAGANGIVIVDCFV
jgi:hypothetical protein